MAESTFDRVSSMLISLLAFFGVIFILLLGIWLTFALFPARSAVPVEIIPFGNTGYSDNAELDPDVVDPGLEIENEEPTLLESLETVNDIISSRSDIFSDPTFDENFTTAQKVGDGRTFGTGDGPAGRPRRWEVQFVEGHTLDLYAQQLDAFQIELGVLQPDGTVAYVYGVSQPQPLKRVGKTEDEKRYYLTWKSGELEKADRELLARAGVDSGNKLVMKFLSPELEVQLAGMEAQHAGKRINEVRATYFAIRKKGNGFEFQVADQTYGR